MLLSLSDTYFRCQAWLGQAHVDLEIVCDFQNTPNPSARYLLCELPPRSLRGVGADVAAPRNPLRNAAFLVHNRPKTLFLVLTLGVILLPGDYVFYSDSSRYYGGYLSACFVVSGTDLLQPTCLLCSARYQPSVRSTMQFAALTWFCCYQTPPGRFHRRRRRVHGVARLSARCVLSKCYAICTQCGKLGTDSRYGATRTACETRY